VQLLEPVLLLVQPPERQLLEPVLLLVRPPERQQLALRPEQGSRLLELALEPLPLLEQTLLEQQPHHRQ
jgi:hypothetical protein